MNSVLAGDFRKCRNIKSRANPDIQCPFLAIHGDYCSRHFKNPRPFKVKSPRIEPMRIYTRKDHAAAKKIQLMWRLLAPLRRYRGQGPAANANHFAVNDTELYNLQPISQIPQVYFMSFADERKCIWAFDIRTLVHSMATGFPSQNPYTRDEMTSIAKARIHARIDWLRARKYHILYIDTDVLSPEQTWNQAVLDVFLKIEALGYYLSCEWYHQMNIGDHVKFYKKLYDLWEFRLGLTRAEKEKVVPGHINGAQKLFKFDPNELLEKSKSWWQKRNLSLMEAFVTRGEDKERRKMGAMYVLMALVQASHPAAVALPWIVDAI